MLVNGDRLAAVSAVMLLSARLRCRRKRHLDIGSIPIEDSRFEELPRGVAPRALDTESADDRRSLGVPLLDWPAEVARLDPCLEPEGRSTGDVLRARPV